MLKSLEVIETSTGQEIHLPTEYRIAATAVTVRWQGDALVLEPVRPDAWPADFFNRIRIEDPSFDRPSQGSMPSAPSFD
jgi:virulence-associated protein VagC